MLNNKKYPSILYFGDKESFGHLDPYFIITTITTHTHTNTSQLFTHGFKKITLVHEQE